MLHHTVALSSPFMNESFGAFCLCNFIIALLLLLSLGRGTTAVRVYDQQKETARNEDDEEVRKSEKCEKPEAATLNRIEKEVSFNIKKDDNGEEDEEEDDEELRRRAEEFIQRIVKVWKVEKQIQRSQLLTN